MFLFGCLIFIFGGRMHRTHRCGEIVDNLIGKEVVVAGWVNSVRDHGSVVFVDLRDESGLVQLVFKNRDIKISKEFVISVSGMVKKRDKDLINTKVPSGHLEIEVVEIKILSKCDLLPFEIENCEKIKEDLRLKYRFLDLRNSKNHDKIILRSCVLDFLRNKMKKLGFLEIQTPILSASSPEGARDYIIPSRKHKGKFYALPQAPQIFKQLLMSSGFDRYYQIAPCFRDEDSRADRSPGEFYQLDFEMAFAEQDDVLKVAETVLYELFVKFKKNAETSKAPFVRIPYKLSMDKYGTDKPDLRNPVTINDVSAVFAKSDFAPFRGKIVKTMCISDEVCNEVKPSSLSRSFFNQMMDFALSIGMQGLGYIKIDADFNFSGPISKFIQEDRKHEFINLSCAKRNSVVFFVAGEDEKVSLLAGKIRNQLAKKLDLVDKNRFEFCFVTDFPMYEKDDDGKVVFKHNPFSMPKIDLKNMGGKDPLEVVAYQYDVVCNGIEISSGAVRNHDPEMLIKAFEIAGYCKEDVVSKFNALYKAFLHGTPPHAGMAPGIERILMFLTESENVRDVVAFPMNSNAQDLLMGAPSEISEEQLKEANIEVRKI
ncbi:MAG: aspartate--tRNA ligase [Candidatus Improbicoccus pseudotrichonymphae]|uniref:Aspartate--tRNA(Asp/Asn) ligase n=1 Tax=Candidatus Improbicoccus pseudotrichonymphae TaxID=3033792 RepID=A0AA48KVD0_9FIRM|nr:MAG: aspartate--tRNA ligase [Candidatus Improbicoccus pseudotrichonymphae]